MAETNGNFKYQVSYKKGEDIYVVRGNDWEEFVLDSEQMKEHIAKLSETPTPQRELPTLTRNYTCSYCGEPATEKSGEKNGRKWKGLFCTITKSHVQWL